MTENSPLAFNTIFLTKDLPADTGITRMAWWGKRFSKMKLVQGIEGNLSFRTQLGFVISGTGVELDNIGSETVVEVTGVVYGLNKTSVYVKGAVVPSRETILHSQIYEVLPEINTIFHVHDSQVMQKAERLGVVVTSLEKEAGSQELAQEAVILLRSNKAIRYLILKNHGIVALGESMDDAGKLVEGMNRKATK